MCIIIDVNVAHRVLLRDDDPDYSPVHTRLFATRGRSLKLAYGGKLGEEYTKDRAITRILVELDRAGRAVRIEDQQIENETQVVIQTGLCTSDDQHIIALARVSHARVLCSHDQHLHTDFTNKHLVDKPRGRVYQRPEHSRLLARPCR